MAVLKSVRNAWTWASTPGRPATNRSAVRKYGIKSD